MKRILIVVAVITILILVKIFFLSGNGHPSKQVGGNVKNQPVRVTAFVVQPSRLSNVIVSSGSLLANEQVELSPETAGKLTGIFFTEGQPVSKGALLVKLNDVDLQAQLHKSQSQLKLADERAVRLEQLLTIKATSQEEYDVAKNAADVIRNDMEYIRAQIAKTEIRAPFSGVAGLRYVSEGAYVAPGTRVAVLQQIDPLKIDFSIPEKYYPFISVNDKISFSVEGTDEPLNGKIYAIDPQINLSTRSVQIRALCENKALKILPGTFARVSLPVSESSEALMIPTEAVIPILKGQKVFVSRNGKAEEVQIETGVRTDARIQVTKGLSSGDTVITTGIMSLRNGTPLVISRVISDQQEGTASR